MSLIKNFLSYRFKNLILRIKIVFLNLFYNKKQKKIFVVGVAEHGNYGDFAISEAQKIFLKDNFDAPIIEISEEEISNPLTYKRIKAMLGPDDIIFLQAEEITGICIPSMRCIDARLYKHSKTTASFFSLRHIISVMTPKAKSKQK